ncbi:MAG: DUF3990 domain-containing protein [Alistipes sp.]|jgi:hypothetical protein|nr:DUF3990 domain-containing protein [Alistipes sp.]
MRVYHGSTMRVKNPTVERGRPSTDFGKGFYTTTNFEQAEKWALIRQRNAGADAKAVVSTYEVDDDLLEKKRYETLRFSAPDGDWLSFVVECRREEIIPHSYAIVFGPVADDKIYETIDLYESGVIDAEQTVVRLKINEFYNQISFHSNEAVRELRFVGAEEV